MKQFAAFAWDGFQGSIELLRFVDGLTDDLIDCICALVGTNTVFIKGGTVTEAGGNTTVTNGFILKDGKIYTFTGSTAAGTPATVKVLFEEKTAAGFPKPKFLNDPILKDIYLDRTARLDPAGTVAVSDIGNIYNLQDAKPLLDAIPGKADQNGQTGINNTYTVAPTFGVYSLSGRYGRTKHDGTIEILCGLTYTGTPAANVLILSNIPAAWGAATIVHRCFIETISSGAKTPIDVIQINNEVYTAAALPSGAGKVLRIYMSYTKP